jgi:chromate transporter
MLLRHYHFLKTVAIYSCTAFGGPQGHIGMMTKTFVEKRKDVTEEELLEYNAFCQMLPGPSSTQTVMLIALKRGGIPLAVITSLLWVLPAALIMGAFALLVTYFDVKSISTNVFKYILPMSVGFVCYAATRMMQSSVKFVATWWIMIGSLLVTIFLHSPWVFPVLLVLAGTISNFSNKRIPSPQGKPKPINWFNLWIFGVVFLIAGICSSLANIQHWHYGRIFNLFENFYRFGSIVWGGGQALLPMMLFQFVDHQAIIKSTDLLTGYGLVQAIPGPVFSVCSFVGGMAMSNYGTMWQVIGSITATIAVFLPSSLLLFFFFPIYQNLKSHVIIFRALEGINAAVVGIIWASGVVLFQSIEPAGWSNLVVVVITFSLLYFTKIPPPLIVVGWLLLGWSML